MNEDKNKVIYSIFFPMLFVLLLWIIKFYELKTGADLSSWGLAPKEIHGLKGILGAPLLHEDIYHLFGNSVPLLILGFGLIYFYKPVAYKVFLCVYIFTGIGVWLTGRTDSVHIGASGLVYGFVTFLFFSGVIRRNTRLLAISLLVVFIYGGVVWGLLPILPHISWESHLFGSIAGTVCAVYFRKQGPQREKYEWENDSDNDDPDTGNTMNVVYMNPENFTETSDTGLKEEKPSSENV